MKSCRAFFALFAFTTAASAATFTVTTTADLGAGSLREALASSDALAGGDTVTFGSGFTGPIVLSSEIVINDPAGVTIDASNVPTGMTIDGGSGYNRIFAIPGNGKLSLLNLTLTSGNGVGVGPSGYGGAIYNEAGTLMLTQCTISGNMGDAAGAIFSHGALTLTQCTLSGNFANYGGAIMNGGTLTLTRCTLSGNSVRYFGGAIYSHKTLVLTQCTISGNSAFYNGGGVYNDGPGTYGNTNTCTLTNTIVAGNTIINNPTNGNGADVANSATLNREGVNIVRFLSNTGDPLGGSGIIVTSPPNLAPLGSYGGQTKTMALLPGSPARNSTVGSITTSDQRGFPIIGTPDIGAYEAGTFTSHDSWIWESLPATATAEQHTATFDFDGDGQTNNTEWLALTDPGDPNSRFTVTTGDVIGDTLPYSFVSALGRSYTMEYTTDFLTWIPAGTTSGTGGTISASVGPVTGFTNFFIRIRAALP